MTGAAGGIGREVVRAFDTAGARVFAVDLRGDASSGLAALDGDGHAARGGRPLAIGMHDALVARGRRRSAGCTSSPIWRPCCGAGRSIDDVTEADWDVQHDVNLKAAFFLCARPARHGAQGTGGRFIAFTSQGW